MTLLSLEEPTVFIFIPQVGEVVTTRLTRSPVERFRYFTKVDKGIPSKGFLFGTKYRDPPVPHLT